MPFWGGKSCRLSVMLALTASFFLVEIVTGYATKSMALVADSFHMLSDVIALIVAFFCMKISKKKSRKNTFGWVRAEVLGALVNAVFLLALCFSIFIESLKRLFEVETIERPVLILITGALGFVVNLIGIFMFHGHASVHGHSHARPVPLGLPGESGQEEGDEEGNMGEKEDSANRKEYESAEFQRIKRTAHSISVLGDDRMDSSDGGEKGLPGHAEGRFNQSSNNKNRQIPVVPLAASDDLPEYLQHDPRSINGSLQNQASQKQESCRTDSITDVTPTSARNVGDTGSADTEPLMKANSGYAGDGPKSNSHPATASDVVPKFSSTNKQSLNSKGPTASRAPSMPQPDAGQLNMHGVFLHILGDAIGSVIVIINALICWQVDSQPVRQYLDPCLSLVMVLIIGSSTVPLLRESAHILLQTVPPHLNIEQLKRRLATEVDGVQAVHEFHVWRLAGNKIIASAHIRCASLAAYPKIAEDVKQFFHDNGIHSTTIQAEFDDMVSLNGSAGLIDRNGHVLRTASGGVLAGGGDEGSERIDGEHEGFPSEKCILECPPSICAKETCCGVDEKKSKKSLPTSGPSNDEPA